MHFCKCNDASHPIKAWLLPEVTNSVTQSSYYFFQLWRPYLSETDALGVGESQVITWLRA
jgi:hypothetical protein